MATRGKTKQEVFDFIGRNKTFTFKEFKKECPSDYHRSTMYYLMKKNIIKRVGYAQYEVVSRPENIVKKQVAVLDLPSEINKAILLLKSHGFKIIKVTETVM